MRPLRCYHMTSFESPKHQLWTFASITLSFGTSSPEWMQSSNQTNLGWAEHFRLAVSVNFDISSADNVFSNGVVTQQKSANIDSKFPPQFEAFPNPDTIAHRHLVARHRLLWLSRLVHLQTSSLRQPSDSTLARQANRTSF